MRRATAVVIERPGRCNAGTVMSIIAVTPIAGESQLHRGAPHRPRMACPRASAPRQTMAAQAIVASTGGG